MRVTDEMSRAAVKRFNEVFNGTPDAESLVNAVLEAALSTAPQEPVAWMLNGNPTSDYNSVRFVEEVCGAKFTPLYAAPVPALDAEGVSEHQRLYDDVAFMADGEIEMTAAENVLAWLLIEKIGVPDDVGYSPKQAREMIERRLDMAMELDSIDEMLSEGQGDDTGYPILPDFENGMSVYAKVEACLHLLERRRDALRAPAKIGGDA